jgi:putative DNA primase/helicase
VAQVIQYARETPEQSAARTQQQATEDALAEAFEIAKGTSLRFDQSRRQWLIYEPDSGIWRPDRREAVPYEIRLFIRARNPNNDARIGRASTVANVERLCRTRPEFSITGDELDADPFTLGTPAGPFDLTTGEGLAPDPDLLISKSTSIAPDFNDPALWLAFLAEATGGDAGMIDYLQRLSGYCLTGSTREEQLTFIWGPGGNGKGVFLGALLDIAGDYGRSTSTDTFLETRNDRNKADLAVLAGKRVAVAQESNEGRKWDGQRIKTVTGRDEVEGRFLYANAFTYRPQFKLLIASNHRPRIPNPDEAWRRRLHLLPFDKRPAQPDPLLKEKLRDEYPAILGWMIQGAVAWHRDGLRVPDTVLEASAQYLKEEDVVGLWFDECCKLDAPTVESTRKELYESFSGWCRSMGHGAPTAYALTRWLKQHKGIEQNMRKPSRPYLGLRLRDPFTEGGDIPSAAAATGPARGYAFGGQDDDDLPL